jgi:PAS domain S-box-containing protein
MINSGLKPSHSLEVLLHRMTDRIRQSLELAEILAATVTEVRAFLATDRVKIYRFHADGSGEVVAESIQAQRLPSLLGHRFPADDIPQDTKDLYRQVRQRTIVDVSASQIGVSLLADEQPNELLTTDIRFRPVDPCHAEYLSAMGVQSSLVVPILHDQQLWGLLVSHHASPRRITKRELQVVQLVADQVAVAIAHATLLNQTRLRAQQEATMNQVVSVLHSTAELPFQQALELIVEALQGTGGRLYIAAQSINQPAQWFVCGEQPAPLETQYQSWHQAIETDELISDALSHSYSFEQHPYWQSRLDPSTERNGVWAIADLYQSTWPSDLVQSLLSANIRGVLIIGLRYQQQILGYLSIFRGAIDVETIWAGRLNVGDRRQSRPRRSFEAWRELKREQAHEWTDADVELAQHLSTHFATAVYQQALYSQIQALNTELERDIEERKHAEIKISALNADLEKRVLERTAELQYANLELRKEISERERARREHQHARDSLKRLSHQHELILNSAGEGIYGLNLQGKITFVNPAAARMLGYDVEQLLDQFMHTVLNHTKPDGVPYIWQESPIYTTLDQGVLQHVTDDLFWRRDGSSFPVEFVSTAIQEQDNILGVVVIFKDITERQIIERMKNEFISVASHELRTPLTSIRTALGLLARGDLNTQIDKSQRMLEIAFSNTNRLVRLVSDILDIERIEFGKVPLKKQRCNAADLMIQTVDVMRAMADKADIQLLITPISVQLWADPDRIIQTLTNLVSNAIKFSPQGSTVWITAELTHQGCETGSSQHPIGADSFRCQSHDVGSVPSSLLTLASNTHCSVLDAPDTLLITVKDQGRGIPEDKLEIIFERFQQLDASDSGHQGGTGLGLAICRSIIQQHGGRIWAESVLGEGSQFSLTLPLMLDM